MPYTWDKKKAGWDNWDQSRDGWNGEQSAGYWEPPQAEAKSTWHSERPELSASSRAPAWSSRNDEGGRDDKDAVSWKDAGWNRGNATAPNASWHQAADADEQQQPYRGGRAQRIRSAGQESLVREPGSGSSADPSRPTTLLSTPDDERDTVFQPGNTPCTRANSKDILARWCNAQPKDSFTASVQRDMKQPCLSWSSKPVPIGSEQYSVSTIKFQPPCVFCWEVESSPQKDLEDAIAIAANRAVVYLHNLGHLDDELQPKSQTPMLSGLAHTSPGQTSSFVHDVNVQRSVVASSAAANMEAAQSPSASSATVNAMAPPSESVDARRKVRI